jgi:hypothetical protein
MINVGMTSANHRPERRGSLNGGAPHEWRNHPSQATMIAANATGVNTL